MYLIFIKNVPMDLQNCYLLQGKDALIIVLSVLGG